MWDFRAYLTRPHDGDSFWVMADTAFGQRYEPELRLLDVHAPELNQLGGRECTEFVNDWFAQVATERPPRRWGLYLQTQQTAVYEPTQRMTFTRYVAEVWPFDRRGPDESLNALVRQYLAGHPEWPSGM
jgi:hypothetical protein